MMLKLCVLSKIASCSGGLKISMYVGDSAYELQTAMIEALNLLDRGFEDAKDDILRSLKNLMMNCLLLNPRRLQTCKTAYLQVRL